MVKSDIPKLSSSEFVLYVGGFSHFPNSLNIFKNILRVVFSTVKSMQKYCKVHRLKPSKQVETVLMHIAVFRTGVVADIGPCVLMHAFVPLDAGAGIARWIWWNGWGAFWGPPPCTQAAITFWCHVATSHTNPEHFITIHSTSWLVTRFCVELRRYLFPK